MRPWNILRAERPAAIGPRAGARKVMVAHYNIGNLIICILRARGFIGGPQPRNGEPKSPFGNDKVLLRDHHENKSFEDLDTGVHVPQGAVGSLCVKSPAGPRDESRRSWPSLIAMGVLQESVSELGLAGGPVFHGARVAAAGNVLNSR